MSREVDWSARAVLAFTGDGVSAVLVWGSGVDQLLTRGCRAAHWASWIDSLARDREEAPRSEDWMFVAEPVS